MASQAATIFIFLIFLGGFGRKILSIFGKKKIVAKMKKNVLSWPFFRHPAASPETDFFFRLALNLPITCFMIQYIEIFFQTLLVSEYRIQT